MKEIEQEELSKQRKPSGFQCRSESCVSLKPVQLWSASPVGSSGAKTVLREALSWEEMARPYCLAVLSYWQGAAQ